MDLVSDFTNRVLAPCPTTEIGDCLMRVNGTDVSALNLRNVVQEAFQSAHMSHGDTDKANASQVTLTFIIRFFPKRTKGFVMGWWKEEEECVDAMIEAFDDGLLGLSDGIYLIDYLAFRTRLYDKGVNQKEPRRRTNNKFKRAKSSGPARKEKEVSFLL